ncbi:hypothetical protein MHYP_G00053720 [Metynnis hypsauchen]
MSLRNKARNPTWFFYGIDLNVRVSLCKLRALISAPALSGQRHSSPTFSQRSAKPPSFPLTRLPLRQTMDDTLNAAFANDTPDYTNFTDEWSADGRETVHFIIRCVIPSVYILIITVGLLGNITLVKIFITTSAMRSVPNIFISSLAVGDLLLLVTCVPVDAFRYFFEEWIFGTVACKLIPVIQLTSVGVSVFTLTALSADRHKAIVNPMDIQTSSAVFWTCLKAISIWVVSVLLAVPEAIFSQVVHMSDRNVTFTACVPYPLSNEMHPKIHSVMIFLVYFLIPLGIISVYYYHIARTLIKSAHDMPGEVSEHSKRQVRPSLIYRLPFSSPKWLWNFTANEIPYIISAISKRSYFLL